MALPTAGFLATAITFGPGRMGFGLFLPAFRDTFGLSTEAAGMIASAGFSGFLVALPLGAEILNRRGPRAPVLIGGTAATIGFMLVSVSESITILAIGIALATSSAGFAWTPYNNAAERLVAHRYITRALSIISTGTTVGVAVAGGLALIVSFTGFGWRLAWMLFAAGALGMTVVNLIALRQVAGDPGAFANTDWQTFHRPETVPLFIAAISYGATSAVYLSFAVDLATESGALAFGSLESAAPLIFVSFGLSGLVGLLTGEIESRTGLVTLVRAIFLTSAVSFALLSFASGSALAVLLSSGLQGAVVMMISAVFSFWSARLFPEIPSVSFTIVLMAVAIGGVLGPLAAGWGAGQIGLEAVFLIATALSLLSTVAMKGRLIERGLASG